MDLITNYTDVDYLINKLEMDLLITELLSKSKLDVNDNSRDLAYWKDFFRPISKQNDEKTVQERKICTICDINFMPHAKSKHLYHDGYYYCFTCDSRYRYLSGLRRHCNNSECDKHRYKKLFCDEVI